MQKIHVDKAGQFIADYKQGKYSFHLRLGQAFVNEFYPTVESGRGEETQELFYEPNQLKAMSLIWRDFVYYE